jgi:cytoskeletal protein CcmA (bactofilin family)
MAMLGRKGDEETALTGEVHAFLGKGTSFEGKIRFEGMFRLEGAFQGEVLSGGSLVVGETGEVKGQINVSNLIIRGKVSGHVTADSRVEITPSGQIRGDIQTSTLIISEGATFDGNCKMEQRRDWPGGIFPEKQGRSKDRP